LLQPEVPNSTIVSTDCFSVQSAKTAANEKLAEAYRMTMQSCTLCAAITFFEGLLTSLQKAAGYLRYGAPAAFFDPHLSVDVFPVTAEKN